MNAHSSATDLPNRRGFLNTGVAASLAAGTLVHSSIAADAEPRPLRLGVVGCGGRGTGAVSDSLSINEGVTLVAAADLYATKCAALRKAMSQAHPGKVAVPDDAMHAGLDSARRVFDDPNVDVVLLTTSPGFRPSLLRAAVEAGKHVFTEKPVCVDAAGYRSCLETHDRAAANGTAIVTGTQYRRQVNYVAAIEQIRQGAIGELVSGVTRYCVTGVWDRPRREGMSDTEYQLDNWYHFVWLSGDHICEQAVHSIDTMNWVMDAPPESAFGTGSRFTRPAHSELWDSFGVEYAYPAGRTVSFLCRQVPGTATDLSQVFHGTKGECHFGASNAGSWIVDASGREIWRMKGSIADAYRQEHKDLIDSIRAGRPIVELRQTADSSLAAVLGRVAAYTGQKVTWKFLAEESQLDLFPRDLAWDAARPPVQHAIPGRTKLI